MASTKTLGQQDPQECSASNAPQLCHRFAEFDAIQPGDQARLRKYVTAEDVESFAQLSGDRNPLHMDESFAQRTRFRKRVVHGMLLASYVSRLLGMHCPGPGALWTQQSLRWLSPVFIGDHIEITLTVKHKSPAARTLTIEVRAVNGNGEVVMEGEGAVSLLEERGPIHFVPITERVAFVNGGSRGIGAAIASALAQTGAAVAINYWHNAADAERLCAAIQAAGGRVMLTCSDAMDQALASDAIKRTEDSFAKPVDILVNTVGTRPTETPFVTLAWEQVLAALEINLKSTFHCCQAVIPGMVAQKSGCIINIGSALKRGTPPPNWSEFLIAKSALEALTRCLASELGRDGVRVNMISPGFLESEGVGRGAERLRRTQTPLQRLCTPHDIAAVVLALCTEAGQFITGADIPVCGGFRM